MKYKVNSERSAMRINFCPATANSKFPKSGSDPYVVYYRTVQWNFEEFRWKSRIFDPKTPLDDSARCQLIRKTFLSDNNSIARPRESSLRVQSDIRARKSRKSLIFRKTAKCHSENGQQIRPYL